MKVSYKFFLPPAIYHHRPQQQPTITTIRGCPSAVTMANVQQLPWEVLLEIAKYASTATLASLCAADRGSNALLTPSLYRRGVELASNKHQIQHNLTAKLIAENKLSSLAKLFKYGLSTLISLWRYSDSGLSSFKLLLMDVSLLQISALVVGHRTLGTVDTTITKLLLDHGAQVNHKDDFEYTTLHYAIADWNSGSGLVGCEMAAMLIEHGAGVNSLNGMGASPLHTAAFGNNFRTIECLVLHGENINTVDNLGNTAVMVAIRKNVNNSHDRVVSELYKYGAQAPPP
jgi:hypothetical protein